jgi:dTDP-4-amino-4,6-dideoxygalactose transaminase
MIKLLIATDTLLNSLRQESVAYALLTYCKQNDGIQLWTLANTIEPLVQSGMTANQIKSLLAGISQIPVNALLNSKAIETGGDFETALLKAAADTFKIQIIVSDRLSGDGKSGFIQSGQQVWEFIQGNEPAGRVDFMNLNLALHPIFDRVDGWYMDIIQNTAFAGGKHVADFEKEFAEFCGSKYAIGVSNGTDALRFTLLAMGIGAGDEVITVPNTFIATSEVITQIGAKPVFVDVTADTYTLDPALLPQKITARTKAIIPVHLYGQVANLDRILEIADAHGLVVLEDACQAHGAIYQRKRAGTFGRAGAFSMYPGKNLGAFGEAGCVITDDPRIDDFVRCLREHGQSKKYYHRMEGYNGRMDNLQAAALRGKLPYLDRWNEQRRHLARLYFTNLNDVREVVLPVVPDFLAHVFHLFVVLVPDPQALADYLKSKDIFTAFHFPVPLHLQQAYRDREQGRFNYPVSERCAEQLISLPMFPELTERQVLKVCAEIRQFFAG